MLGLFRGAFAKDGSALRRIRHALRQALGATLPGADPIRAAQAALGPAGPAIDIGFPRAAAPPR